MLYREIIAVCSQIHTRHINTLCGQNIEFFVLNLVVYKISNRLKNVKRKSETVEKIRAAVHKKKYQLLVHFASFSINFTLRQQTRY